MKTCQFHWLTYFEKLFRKNGFIYYFTEKNVLLKILIDMKKMKCAFVFVALEICMYKVTRVVILMITVQ